MFLITLYESLRRDILDIQHIPYIQVFAERNRHELEGQQFRRDARLTVMLYGVGLALYFLPLKKQQETGR